MTFVAGKTDVTDTFLAAVAEAAEGVVVASVEGGLGMGIDGVGGRAVEEREQRQEIGYFALLLPS